MFPTIEAQTRLQTPPTWAVLDSELMDKMNAAGPQVLRKRRGIPENAGALAKRAYRIGKDTATKITPNVQRRLSFV